MAIGILAGILEISVMGAIQLRWSTASCGTPGFYTIPFDGCFP